MEGVRCFVIQEAYIHDMHGYNTLGHEIIFDSLNRCAWGQILFVLKKCIFFKEITSPFT